MATVQRHIAAHPSEVFAVLADGWLYSGWVVGTSHMRAVEREWPAAGSRLYHASGAWPFVTRDETKVESVTPGRTLELTARGRPFGEAHVSIVLSDATARASTDAASTLVTMSETPVAGPGKWLHNPASEALLARRNRESLARLDALVQRPTQPPER